MDILPKTVFFTFVIVFVFSHFGNAVAQSDPLTPDFSLPDSLSLSESGDEETSSSGGGAFDFLSEPSGAPAESRERFDFEKSAEELEAEGRRKAFESALEGLMPLKPEEIREVLERMDRTEEAASFPVYPEPRPEISVQTISADPGAKPTTIKVARGYVTTVTIVDSTGAPWPIQDITWAGEFDIVQNTTGGPGNLLRITPQAPRAYGNMSIKMLDMQTPIILSLESSRDVVFYRFDAIIPEPGPKANVPLVEQGGVSIQAGDVNLSSFLEGVPPVDATRLNVMGLDSRTTAFEFGGLTYLRTPHTLLSPAWEASVSSADGMRVYSLRPSPVLLLSDKGRMVRARLSSREGLINE